MKAQIEITGQINGNHTLLGLLNNGNYRKGQFYSYTIEYKTIGEAKKAIAHAWRQLKQENDFLSNWDGKNKDNTVLRYDASQAKLII